MDAAIRDQMHQFRDQMTALRKEMRKLQLSLEPEQVTDYHFDSLSGPVTLSELLGDKDTLFVVHNMGKGCMYCTLWADGLNGVIDHLRDRAAFVISSPDDVATQQAFAAERGWRFPMVSHAGTDFARDMGYTGEHGFEPGVSVFQRHGDNLVRVSNTPFGPGDDFCVVWPLFDLIPSGPGDWQPRFSYST